MGTAFAQAGPGSGPPAVYNIGFLLVLVGIFYFLLLRPEQKRRREQQKLIDNLKRNDQVVLASGIHGRIVALGDKTVTVEVAPRVSVQVERSAIQSVHKASVAEPREKERGEKS